MGWLFAAIGVFAICGAVFNWDWFMNNRRARFFVAILGRGGARVFYGLLGSGLTVMGLMMATGVIESS